MAGVCIFAFVDVDTAFSLRVVAAATCAFKGTVRVHAQCTRIAVVQTLAALIEVIAGIAITNVSGVACAFVRTFGVCASGAARALGDSGRTFVDVNACVADTFVSWRTITLESTDCVRARFFGAARVRAGAALVFV